MKISLCMKVDWSKDNLEKIIKESFSKVEVFEKINLRNVGSNYKTLNKYIELYEIDISHFHNNFHKMKMRNQFNTIPMCDILVENSTYSRTHLKKRLYDEGYLKPICCLCGQNEYWNGMKIALILDHINGIPDDNRICNLRIVCPNCNAGLETFAGRNNRGSGRKYFCECGNTKGKHALNCVECCIMKRRTVPRPEIDILWLEVNENDFSATARKYNVSDNSIRKWLGIKK